MLIDGKKFDLRLYVLVTSCDPLRIYLFRDGLCRLCTVDFVKPSGKNMKDRCAHLTNYSVNKKSAAFIRDNDCAIDDDTGDICAGGDCGSKRSVSWLLSWLRMEHGDEVVDRLWCSIGDICVKTILSILPTLVSEYRATFDPASVAGRGEDREAENESSTEQQQLHQNAGVKGSRCFEILGFDIMLDDKLKPHLIEVNHLPSFGTDALLDKAIKSKVIEQAMGVVRAKSNDKRVHEKSQRRKSRHRLVNRRTSSLLLPDPCEDDGNDDDDDGFRVDDADTAHKHALPPTAESILTAIYKEHAPEKLDKVPSMLIKYRGYEEWLIAKVRERYCNPSRSTPDEDDSDDEDEQLDCPQHESSEAADRPYNMHHDEYGSASRSGDRHWAEEESVLTDYDRIYPPQPQHKRPLSIPPYNAMEEHAFEESAKQVERLTVPLHQSRADENDQNDGDTANLGDFALLTSQPNRADSWISGSLHLRRASAPTKIRHPPTRKQIQCFDRLSRGYHANEDADGATGEADSCRRDIDPFNASLTLAQKEASILSTKRWDLVRRVRQELDEAKERRLRNHDRTDRARLGLSVHSLEMDLLGSNQNIGGAVGSAETSSSCSASSTVGSNRARLGLAVHSLEMGIGGAVGGSTTSSSCSTSSIVGSNIASRLGAGRRYKRL